MCEQHTESDTESAKVQTHSSKTAYFWLFSANGSALWRAHHLTLRPRHHQTGGIARHEGHQALRQAVIAPPNGGNSVIRTATRR